MKQVWSETVQVSVTLPTWIVAVVDEERGDISRSKYLFRKIEHFYPPEKKHLY